MKIILFLLCAFGLAAQNDSGTRELFFFRKSHPPATTTKAAPVIPFGLRYSILKRNRTGQLTEVDSSTEFRSGDRIRLHFTANQDGFLYVVHEGTSGRWDVLYPSSPDAPYALREMLPMAVPQTDDIEFFSSAGVEKLFVVASKAKIPDLERMIPGRKSPLQIVTAAILNALRPSGTRDLRIQKVGPSTGGAPEAATYLVNAPGTKAEPLITEIKLLHK